MSSWRLSALSGRSKDLRNSTHDAALTSFEDLRPSAPKRSTKNLPVGFLGSNFQSIVIDQRHVRPCCCFHPSIVLCIIRQLNGRNCDRLLRNQKNRHFLVLNHTTVWVHSAKLFVYLLEQWYLSRIDFGFSGCEVKPFDAINFRERLHST